MKKTALVLTGGGARAAYQVGVLKALGEILSDRPHPFDIFSGTSAGSINAGFLASEAQDFKGATLRLSALWQNLKLDQIYYSNGLALTSVALAWIKRTVFGWFIRNHRSSNYMLDTAPLKKLVTEQMNFEQMHSHLQSGLLSGVSFTAFEYSRSRTVSFYGSNSVVEPWKRSGRLGIPVKLQPEHVLASAAIPVFFPPVFVSDRYYGDGSLREVAPLSPSVHLGADRILAISIRYEDVKADAPITDKNKAPSLADISGELMHALFLDALDSDSERLLRVNQVSERFPEAALKNIPILTLSPSQNLSEVIPNLLQFFPATLRFLFRGLGVSSNQGNELLSYLAFLPECVNPLIALGYSDTVARRSEIEKFLA